MIGKEDKPTTLSRRESLIKAKNFLAAVGLNTAIPIKVQDMLVNLAKTTLLENEKPRSSEAKEKRYQFLNGVPLGVNNHGLLFNSDIGNIASDIDYAVNLGAKTIRVFATDNNSGNQWNGEQVGKRIVEIAPFLRNKGTKLVVALTNNHRPVPGEPKDSFAFFGGYDQLTEKFYKENYTVVYTRFVKDLISTVKQARALDVIFAWEPVNEGHTPDHPQVFVDFFKKMVNYIRTIDTKTTIAPGTMGINHLHPNSQNSPIVLEFYKYLQKINSYITVHAYDLILDNNFKVVSSGDMPISWDFDLLANHREIKIPLVVEEIGTSKELSSYWDKNGQDKRLRYELRMAEYVKERGAVAVCPWSGGWDHRRGDCRRGLTSWGEPNESTLSNGKSNSLRAILERSYQNWP